MYTVRIVYHDIRRTILKIGHNNTDSHKNQNVIRTPPHESVVSASLRLRVWVCKICGHNMRRYYFISSEIVYLHNIIIYHRRTTLTRQVGGYGFAVSLEFFFFHTYKYACSYFLSKRIIYICFPSFLPVYKDSRAEAQKIIARIPGKKIPPARLYIFICTI